MMLARRWALNRADLGLGIVALCLISAVIAVPVFSKAARVSLLGKPDFDDAVATALLAAWVAIVLAGIGGGLKITSTRQSLTSLFTSEIRALQFGLSTMEMFKFWTAVFENPELGGFGCADVPRDEDYFQTFHSLSDNIGNLHPRTVEALVRFYTYLKMSRDAAAALHSWREQTSPKIRQVHVLYVVRLLALSMVWGFVALHSMGAPCQASDQEFLTKIRQAYDAVSSVGAFRDLVSRHPRQREIRDFFRSLRPADPSLPLTP